MKSKENGEEEGRGGGVRLGVALVVHPQLALLPLPRVRGSVGLPLGERSKADRAESSLSLRHQHCSAALRPGFTYFALDKPHMNN